jgi:hypothetical protein
MYTLSDYADIPRVIVDSQYAKSKGVIVKSQRLKNVIEIEDKLKAIPSDDPEWREKVTLLKRELSEAKKSNEKRLHIIKYNKNSLNSENVSSLGLFRSIVTDGSRILSFSPVKSISNEAFETQSTGTNAFEYSEFVEGTMINMFVDPKTDDWEIATRSNIGARCKFYQDFKLTFREMFLEAFRDKKLDFTMFNKRYSYSWVLQHPENRIVQPIAVPNIVLVGVYTFTETNLPNSPTVYMVENILTEENKDDFITWDNSEYILETPNNHSRNTIQEYQNHYKSDNTDYRIMGTVIYDRNSGMRTKIRNKSYEHVKNLKGNSPKLQYRYYSLRQLRAVSEYLKYYPEDSHKFSKFREQLHEFTDQLWRNYFRCYVKKEKPLKEFPFEYRSHMFKLHKHYIDELRVDGGRVDKLFVINYINKLPPGHIMHSINYPLLNRDKQVIENVLKREVEDVPV